MWTRETLKERAKGVLRKYYWIAFAVVLLASILGATYAVGSYPFGYHFNSGDFRTHPFGFQNWQSIDMSSPEMMKLFAGLLIGGAVLSGLAAFGFVLRYAWRIFVSGPVETGMDRYFLDARQDKSDFANLFYSFRSGRYMKIVAAIAWRELFHFLWTLLFIIPGWIKGYSYSMIPYLMADNPGMDYKRAMKLSMAMTNGEKWNIFVLDLSFLGWFLLGMLCCGLGVLFLNPYIYATKAELYVTLRQKALDSGLCTAAELGL